MALLFVQAASAHAANLDITHDAWRHNWASHVQRGSRSNAASFASSMRHWRFVMIFVIIRNVYKCERPSWCTSL